nr:hypothetical protein CFP56_02694 [Quercus suber]
MDGSRNAGGGDGGGGGDDDDDVGDDAGEPRRRESYVVDVSSAGSTGGRGRVVSAGGSEFVQAAAVYCTVDLTAPHRQTDGRTSLRGDDDAEDEAGSCT